jgi:uncharacterized LabA/DUF88 family protein
MQHLYENLFDKAIIVSSDGDYVPLVKLLIEKKKMEVLISPYGARYCSVLLKRSNVKIIYLEDQKTVLEIDGTDIIAENKKAPDEDKTS